MFETSYLFVRNKTELTTVLTHLPLPNGKTGGYRSISLNRYYKVYICGNLCVITNRIRIACVKLLIQKPPLFFRISYGFPVAGRCLDLYL